ncbi:TauD/TfdA family dioxygenase [Streptomyces sp. NPDC014733]|uniref:TauD/TfdA family dioxygenase n=1 Tax=Streptomyces sp. NPDC014733 TaxID=3364885 RepID=UPI0036FFE78B
MTVHDLSAPLAKEGRTHDLELTGSEHRAVEELATALAATPPRLLDHPSWLERARQLGAQLPPRLREAVRDYRHDPGVQGALLLRNLPTGGDALPDTPSVKDSVERTATVAAATGALIGLALGELVAYREEKSGALVQNVVPVRGLESSQSNAGSAAELELHVENAFHPFRPDFVGLLCLRSDTVTRAGTRVACVRQALPLIDEADTKVLLQSRFVTAPPPSFRSGEGAWAHPVLDGSPDDPNICVDFHATTALDDEAAQVLERLRRTFGEVAQSVRLAPGEMVLVDNRVVLHGRDHFTPRYDGRDRWLQRIFVHLDNRRTRGHRTGNGAVMV